MEELVKVINDIQCSNYVGDKGFLCRAVQEYYKILEQAQVIKPKVKKETKKAVKKETPKKVVIGE